MQSTGHTSTQAASLVPTHGSQMIYAKVVSRQPGKYNSERRARWFAAAVGVVTLVVSLHAAQTWRDAPELVPLFAPEGPRSAAFSMRVADADLETVMRQLDGDAASESGPGAWDVRGRCRPPTPSGWRDATTGRDCRASTVPGGPECRTARPDRQRAGDRVVEPHLAVSRRRRCGPSTPAPSSSSYDCRKPDIGVTIP